VAALSALFYEPGQGLSAVVLALVKRQSQRQGS